MNSQSEYEGMYSSRGAKIETPIVIEEYARNLAESKPGWQTFTVSKLTIVSSGRSATWQEASAESAEVGRSMTPQLRFHIRFRRTEVKRGGGEAINFTCCGRSPASIATGVPFARCSVGWNQNSCLYRSFDNFASSCAVCSSPADVARRFNALEPSNCCCLILWIGRSINWIFLRWRGERSISTLST